MPYFNIIPPFICKTKKTSLHICLLLLFLRKNACCLHNSTIIVWAYKFFMHPFFLPHELHLSESHIQHYWYNYLWSPYTFYILYSPLCSRCLFIWSSASHMPLLVHSIMLWVAKWVEILEETETSWTLSLIYQIQKYLACILRLWCIWQFTSLVIITNHV